MASTCVLVSKEGYLCTVGFWQTFQVKGIYREDIIIWNMVGSLSMSFSQEICSESSQFLADNLNMADN